MATAHTICGSGDTSIVYPKNNKPSPAEIALYWRDIYAAERIANSSYRIVGDCAQADLVVKITLDTLSNDISLVVTEGDSGAYVFSETRAIQDKRSDLVHAAQHFRDAVKSAQLAAEAEQSRLAEEYRHQQQAEAAKREHQRCQTDFDSLKQNIIAYRDIQNKDLPQSIQEQIKVHNGLCTNQISIEVVENQRKAEIEAKAAQQEAATEQAAREKSAAQLEKAKADAFVVWAKQMANAPFVPPVEGWTHEADLGSALWYIILPKTGFASNCRLAMNGSHPVLDCPDSGQNDYISVVNNEQQGLWRRDSRWYLLKADRIKDGYADHASTIKDGGLTLCLRQAGCYHVLAELRQEPTALPEKVEVPPPAKLNAIYSSDDVTFNYPQNWKLEEKRSKENIVNQVNVAPPEAHLATWVTHGLFFGHVPKIPDNFAQTLDGAYDQFSAYERLRGLLIGNARTQILGDRQGRVASYTSASVFKAGESGWIAVVKDKSQGYFFLLMFCPSNDDVSLYTQTFDKMFETFKFKK